MRNIVSFHGPLMDGRQQIVAASTDLSRNVVTSTSNGACVVENQTKQCLTETYVSVVLA